MRLSHNGSSRPKMEREKSELLNEDLCLAFYLLFILLSESGLKMKLQKTVSETRMERKKGDLLNNDLCIAFYLLFILLMRGQDQVKFFTTIQLPFMPVQCVRTLLGPSPGFAYVHSSHQIWLCVFSSIGPLNHWGGKGRGETSRMSLTSTCCYVQARFLGMETKILFSLSWYIHSYFIINFKVVLLNKYVA